jgi:hypothetical protein
MLSIDNLATFGFFLVILGKCNKNRWLLEVNSKIRMTIAGTVA